jgi:hypothetical protein
LLSGGQTSTAREGTPEWRSDHVYLGSEIFGGTKTVVVIVCHPVVLQSCGGESSRLTDVHNASSREQWILGNNMIRSEYTFEHYVGGSFFQSLTQRRGLAVAQFTTVRLSNIKSIH